MEKADNNSFHLNARYQPSTFILRQSNHVEPTGEEAHDNSLIEDYKTGITEFGGDVTRPLAGGAIKFVGLANRQRRTTLDEYDSGDLGHTEVVGGSQQLTKSQRNETIGRLTWSRQDLFGFQFEAGGEAALNTLDYHQELFLIEEGGEKMPIDLPIQDARVKENRGEVWVNGGKMLTKKLRMDAGLNFEFSHLTVNGDASADRRAQIPEAEHHLRLAGAARAAHAVHPAPYRRTARLLRFHQLSGSLGRRPRQRR